MKALLAFALVGFAAAAPVINEQYIKLNTETFQCEIQPGYAFTFHTDTVTTLAETSPADVIFNGAVVPNTNDNTATSCVPAAQNIDFLAVCAAGYVGSGLTETTQTKALAASNTGNTAFVASMVVLTDEQAAIWDQPYDFTTNTFVCTAEVIPAVGCNYTCTGAGCVNSSGFVSNGTDFSVLCNSLYVDVQTLAACPAAGLNTTTEVVCTNDAALVPADRWFELARQYPGYSVPNKCGCLTDPVCPDTITCSQCYLSCSQTRAQKRQATVAAAVFCPPATTTIAEMKACFLAGACAGAIQPGDTCVYGPIGAGTNPCPTCDDGSKKGLLGLLGLLGLIPLILCLLCCSLLLCLIRRKKKERDVHFATFDAGAPAVLAPEPVHCAPVALTHSHMHHATYVGAPHVDAHLVPHVDPAHCVAY